MGGSPAIVVEVICFVPVGVCDVEGLNKNGLIPARAGRNQRVDLGIIDLWEDDDCGNDDYIGNSAHDNAINYQWQIVQVLLNFGKILAELIIFERKLLKTLVGVAGGNEYSINGIVECLQLLGDLNISIL